MSAAAVKEPFSFLVIPTPGAAKLGVLPSTFCSGETLGSKPTNVPPLMATFALPLAYALSMQLIRYLLLPSHFWCRSKVPPLTDRVPSST